MEVSYILFLRCKTLNNEQNATEQNRGKIRQKSLCFLPPKSILSMAVFLHAFFTATKCLLEGKAKMSMVLNSLLSRKMVIFLKRETSGPDTCFDKWEFYTDILKERPEMHLCELDWFPFLNTANIRFSWAQELFQSISRSNLLPQTGKVK